MKKMRLLRAFAFVMIDEIILIPKKRWKDKLFISSQNINIIYPNEENVFMVPNHEKKMIIMYIYDCQD